MDISSAQAEALPPATIPAGVLSTFSRQDYPVMYAEHRALARSLQGIFQSTDVDHSSLVTPRGDRATIAMIVDVERQARAIP